MFAMRPTLEDRGSRPTKRGAVFKRIVIDLLVARLSDEPQKSVVAPLKQRLSGPDPVHPVSVVGVASHDALKSKFAADCKTFAARSEALAYAANSLALMLFGKASVGAPGVEHAPGAHAPFEKTSM